MKKADRPSRDVESFKTRELLHPEMMDLETISDILKQRGVDLQNQTMERALEVYHVLILPKSQRVLEPGSRVGQRLLKNRENIRKKASPEKNKSDWGSNKSPTKFVSLQPAPGLAAVASVKRPFTVDPQDNNNEECPAMKKRRTNINWP